MNTNLIYSHRINKNRPRFSTLFFQFAFVTFIALFSNQLLADSVQPSVLLIYDSNNKASKMDQTGVAQALSEFGISHSTLDVQNSDFDLSTLEHQSAVVLSEFKLNQQQIFAVSRYVDFGGGLLVSGKAASGLETVLGIQSYQPKNVLSGADVRFDTAHPVSYGAFWEGPAMTSPLMPATEIPSITQFLYGNNDTPGYSAKKRHGQVIGHWYDDVNTWELGSAKAAVIVNRFGFGRTIYSGALPGAYTERSWPRTWQSLILNAVEWLSSQSYLVELGNWPNAHQASFILSSDAETREMIWIVPRMLDLFSNMNLSRFGTFYFTAEAGGDEGTEGAVDNPDIAEMAAQAGSEIAGHGDIHLGFGADTFDVQLSRMLSMRDSLNAIIEPFGEKISGFRAPHVDVSKNTFIAAKQVGLYDSSDIDVWSETTRPFFNGNVWELPPTMPMDYNLFETNDLSDADALSIYKDKLDYVYARRGMFNMLTHPWIIGYHMDTLTGLLQYAIDKNDIWLARQDDVLSWWIQREKIRITETHRSGNTITTRVINSGTDKVNDVSIWVKAPLYINHSILRARIGSKRVNSVLKRRNGHKYLVAIISELAAGQSVTLTVQPRD